MMYTAVRLSAYSRPASVAKNCVQQLARTSLHCTISTFACSATPLLHHRRVSAGRMLATGHPDARVRIWDTRTQGETLTRASLSSHRQWIADVKWAPGSETMVRVVLGVFYALPFCHP